jgi:error-prone DNA polymerase
MGFYAPAQLVQDARRHGVEVRPVDALASGWECTLEPDASGAPAVRLGLLMVKGLSEAAAQRIVQARANGFSSVDELMRRAQLDRHELKCLAAGNALAGIAGHRRHAYWQVAGVDTALHLLSDAAIHETDPRLRAPSEGDGLIADYRSLGLTLGRHPLALLRPRLARMRLAAADEVRRLPHGSAVHAVGIVIGRQRPDTASGVVFVTLEDETGCVNVIVWRDVGERQRRELLGAKLMAVYGSVEREGEVVHVIAKRLADHSELLGRLATSSRDFH